MPSPATAWWPRWGRRSAGRPRASNTSTRSFVAAASRSWPSGTAESCPPPSSSAAGASSSSRARTSTANGLRASSSGSGTAPLADRRHAAVAKRCCNSRATWRRESPPRSRLTALVVRPASPRRAPSGWRKPPAIRCCRFMSRPIATGPRTAGIGRRSPSRSRRSRIAIGEPLEVPAAGGDEALEAARRELEVRLHTVEKRALELASRR